MFTLYKDDQFHNWEHWDIIMIKTKLNSVEPIYIHKLLFKLERGMRVFPVNKIINFWYIWFSKLMFFCQNTLGNPTWCEAKLHVNWWNLLLSLQNIIVWKEIEDPYLKTTKHLKCYRKWERRLNCAIKMKIVLALSMKHFLTI